jgi:hypothetical protein
MTKGEETKSIPVTQQMVWNAYHKVKSNGGSAGIDKVSLEEFKIDLDKNLYKIWNRLTSGSYFPPAVREKSIPKKDGSKRKLDGFRGIENGSHSPASIWSIDWSKSVSLPGFFSRSRIRFSSMDKCHAGISEVSCLLGDKLT